MGLFDIFIKAFAKTVSDYEYTNSPQAEADRIEREYGVKVIPQEYKPEQEFQEHFHYEQKNEKSLFEQLHESGQNIIDRARFYQNEYVNGRLRRGRLIRELENAYDDLNREILSSNNIIAPQIKYDIMTKYKKEIDYIRHTWLPSNREK